MARPNIGTVAGGVWVWDDTAYLPWDVPYSANYTALPLPADTDLDRHGPADRRGHPRRPARARSTSSATPTAIA